MIAEADFVKVLGLTRVLAPEGGECRVGRVAVEAGARGRGLGTAVMRDLDGYRKGDAVKLTIAESTALDEDGLNEVRDQAASVSESMKMISGFVAVYDEMGEQELADAGMTADDVAQMKDYVAKLSKIGTFFEEAEIDEGCKLKLTVKVGDDAQELEKTAIRLNGNWVFADLIELMA